MDVARLGAHGSFYGRDQYDERLVTLVLNLIPDSLNPLDDLCDQIERALVVQQTGNLNLLLNNGSKQIGVRPVIWDVPRDPSFGNERAGIATIQLRAADPFLYAALEDVITLASATHSGGWSWPWTWPWSWGSGTFGGASITNRGTIEAGAWFRVHGPFDVGFELRNLTTGRSLKVGIPMTATDFTDVDMQAETILFQAVSNRRSEIIQGSDFWTVPPGVSVVGLDTLGASSVTTADIRFRSCWTSLSS
jgi:hypothetical protein